MKRSPPTGDDEVASNPSKRALRGPCVGKLPPYHPNGQRLEAWEEETYDSDDSMFDVDHALYYAAGNNDFVRSKKFMKEGANVNYENWQEGVRARCK